MYLPDFIKPSADRHRPDPRPPYPRPDPTHASEPRPPLSKPIDLRTVKKRSPSFTVIFTEDKNGFYINGKKFAMDAEPMTSVRVGSYQHWRIENPTGELHPFHMHQAHFLAYAQNCFPLQHPAFSDTLNVPSLASLQ